MILIKDQTMTSNGVCPNEKFMIKFQLKNADALTIEIKCSFFN